MKPSSQPDHFGRTTCLSLFALTTVFSITALAGSLWPQNARSVWPQFDRRSRFPLRVLVRRP
jgi:hypothetical protein